MRSLAKVFGIVTGMFLVTAAGLYFGFSTDLTEEVELSEAAAYEIGPGLMVELEAEQTIDPALGVMVYAFREKGFPWRHVCGPCTFAGDPGQSGLFVTHRSGDWYYRVDATPDVDAAVNAATGEVARIAGPEELGRRGWSVSDESRLVADDLRALPRVARESAMCVNVLVAFGIVYVLLALWGLGVLVARRVA